VAVVREPVQQRRGHLRVDEHAGPLGEVQVGRDHDAGVLVQLAQQVEQQGPAGLAERQVAQLVQDDEVRAQQARCDAPGLALGLLALQRVDQVHRRVEPHPLAVLGDAGHADGRGQVGLARARPAHEHHVVRWRVNSQLASCVTSLRSTGETSKSKPARSRCTGNLAVAIWWLTERVARSLASALSMCSMSQRDRSSSALFCSPSSAQVAAMPCSRSALSSAMTSRIWSASCSAGRRSRS
jgi:hypothetical protein